ncbi:MAG: LLM class flavin-dependent oxidoreductase, partial [Acidimicrobiaceae bacterium]|nr:LLM class flavin-dependent oxidoreductase [Acidimicrobiaceae bacterium]
FSRASSNPKPKAGRIPIHIGGHSEAAARRAGRVGDGLFLAGGDMAHLLDLARNTAADCGRDPESLEMSAVHLGLFGDDPVAAIQEAESWGVERLMVPSVFYFRNTAEGLAEFGESVIAPNS